MSVLNVCSTILLRAHRSPVVGFLGGAGAGVASNSGASWIMTRAAGREKRMCGVAARGCRCCYVRDSKSGPWELSLCFVYVCIISVSTRSFSRARKKTSKSGFWECYFVLVSSACGEVPKVDLGKEGLQKWTLGVQLCLRIV